jgi:hypothetical protein
MNRATSLLSGHLFLAPLVLAVIAVMALGDTVSAQTQSPQQVLAAMEKCREQVISQLSFGDKMKMRAAMDAIQDDPRFVAANNAIKNAPTPEAQIGARKALAKVKLDLIAQKDPSLKPVVEKIRAAQATVLE